MPPLPFPPSPTLRVVYEFDVGADGNAIVRHFVGYSGTPPNTAACIDIANEFFEVFDGTLWGADTTLAGVNIEDISSPGTGATGTGTDAPLVGSDSGNPVPGSACVLVNGAIDRRYRGGKPRSYWPFGTSDNLNTPQLWKSEFVGACQTQLNNLHGVYQGFTISGCNGTGQVCLGYYTGVVMYPTSNPDRTKPRSLVRATPLSSPIISVAVNPKVASQRRRNLNRS